MFWYWLLGLHVHAEETKQSSYDTHVEACEELAHIRDFQKGIENGDKLRSVSLLVLCQENFIPCMTELLKLCLQMYFLF